MNNGKAWYDNVKNSKYPWHHMCTIQDTPEIRRDLLGLVVQVAIQVLLQNFCYTFGGRIYHQLWGGPIGARITMAVAQIVMEFISGNFIKTWKNSNWKKIDED